jgi:predicted nucleic acid-binding protein
VILVDTSIWVDHLRDGDADLVALLMSNQVLVHGMVIGEIALGQLKQRKMILDLLLDLPTSKMAQDFEVLEAIDRHEISGTGIGYVDVHLLTSAMLSNAKIWTRDKKLLAVARKLGLAMS